MDEYYLETTEKGYLKKDPDKPIVFISKLKNLFGKRTNHKPSLGMFIPLTGNIVINLPRHYEIAIEREAIVITDNLLGEEGILDEEDILALFHHRFSPKHIEEGCIKELKDTITHEDLHKALKIVNCKNREEEYVIQKIL